MSREPRHDILFEPVTIGPKTLRNRFYQVPHCTGFGTEKPWSQARLREMKAEGGWAAVNTEYAPIDVSSDVWPDVACNMWDETDQASLALMCEAAHEHGALAGIELTHAFGHSLGRHSRIAAMAPSQLANDWDPMIVPKAMRLEDIDRVKEMWVDAALRARDTGFDIIYVYGAHSVGPLQFLSPYYNKRTDAYGGSLLNRARLWLELLEELRGVVGKDCALAVRMAVEALGPAGVELSEALEFIKMADPLVDLWDVNVGSMAEWSKDSGASRFFKEGYQLEWTGQVRSAASKPIVGVGRITNPDTMANFIRSGVWDLIGAARPSIADPFLPQKIQEGRYGDIRECIGCNVCIAKSDFYHHVGCTQNATLGEEYRRGWHPERFSRADNADRNVLVVGAGPAGMECAIVLGKRGMNNVHLIDGADDIGGHLNWLTRLPGVSEWGRVTDYRRIQLQGLPNVTTITGQTLTTEEIFDYGAEIVIIATGSTWSRLGLNVVTHLPIPGADSAEADRVLTPEDIMVKGIRPAGPKVVVYDSEGYHVAAGIAEKLSTEGYQVQLVTPLEQIAPFCDQTLEGALLRQRLHDCGVVMKRDLIVDEICVPDGLRGRTTFGDPVEIEANSIVLVTQRLSNDALYHELVDQRERFADSGIEQVYRIGDCVAPRLISEAVFDGHRLGREIDSSDPDVPRPYFREIPLATFQGLPTFAELGEIHKLTV